MFDQNTSGGLTLEYSKLQLLEILNENKRRHNEVYQEALDGYRVALQQRLSEIGNYALLKADQLKTELVQVKDKHLFISDLTKPEHHLEDYDRVIQMLQLTTQDMIPLTQADFRRFVQDQWDWKQSFHMSSARYLDT